MQTYEFTIVASGLDPRAEDFESRFYDAGCNDATVSFQKGHIILDFAREAENVCDAFASAVEQVREAGATVDRIEPDPLVSLADIASRSEMTRAAMSQYASGLRGSGFPYPVAKVTSLSPLWEWSAVSKWLFARGRIARDRVIEAEAVRISNSVIASNDNFRMRLCAQMQSFEMAL